MAPTIETVESAANRIQELVDIEQTRKPKAYKLGEVVPNVSAITAEWLTDALCKWVEGAKVVDFQITPVSVGTHARHRVTVDYNVQGQDGGLPTALFSKTLPTMEHRMISGITGHARTEGNFYTQIRPELDLETPFCFASTVDRESCAAIHLLEDVSATRGAQFTDYASVVTLDMARNIVELLADLHAHFYADPRFQNSLKWVATYPAWFMGGVNKLHVDQYHEAALDRAADLIPDRLLKQRKEMWRATLQSLRVHKEKPNTFLHSDVHIGNWYKTADGKMGLCDWQCATRGHWSRDLAYALSAALRIDDRRRWEKGLIEHYLARFESTSGQHCGFDEAWVLYRQQMFHALLMWTPTLCHSEHLPNMQPDEVSLAMIERIATAIDDLECVQACGEL